MTKIKWALDPTHSEVNFKIKHLMITNVTGGFKSFQVEAETDGDDFANASVTFSADVASISTNNEQRDGHLKAAEFFDAEKFSTIKFQSTKFEKDGDDFLMEGNVTIKDITAPIKLNVEFGGVAKDPWGNIKAGFTISGKMNRKDWGLNWNAALETGGVMVSEEVKINADIQMVKQA